MREDSQNDAGGGGEKNKGKTSCKEGGTAAFGEENREREAQTKKGRGKPIREAEKERSKGETTYSIGQSKWNTGKQTSFRKRDGGERGERKPTKK